MGRQFRRAADGAGFRDHRSDAHPARCEECDDLDTCGTRLVMAEVKQAVSRTLENITLADLVERSRAERNRRRNLVDFSI